MSTPREIFGLAATRVHLVGASGMGMAPLGLYLAQLGFAVTGEDDGWNPALQDLLARQGVKFSAPGELPDATQLVVYSSAIAPTHPSRRQATARALPQVRRGEMLAEIAKGKKLVAVAGSHGKTTTTAMLITALQAAQFNCGWVLGGIFQNEALPPARASAAEWLIAEIDESDGTIGGFAPEVTLTVNLDWDHADRYARLEDLEAAFAALFARTHGAVFVSDACALSARIVTAGPLRAAVRTFGRTGDFQGRLTHEKSGAMSLALGGAFALKEARVQTQGEFNAANATAALAVAQHLGAAITPDALGQFAGVHRRQALLHASTVKIYEDYAHHPTEIRALLAALRRGTAGRLLVVFQPHRYTRTAQFKAEFAAALAMADTLFLMDVYAASEAPVQGGSAADIYVELEKTGAQHHVTYLPGDDVSMLAKLRAALKPGDTLAFVGAGDIETTARQFVTEFQVHEQRETRWSDFIVATRPQLAGDTKFLEREVLAPKTTMRVGGPARIYVEPTNAEELRVVLVEAKRRELPVCFLGRGSNLIVPDAGVDAVVISLNHANWQKFEPAADGRAWAGAGLRLKNLCGLAIKAGLQGFEFLEGIPGSVGGALRMNAGAMGGWMFDVVDEVHASTSSAMWCSTSEGLPPGEGGVERGQGRY